MSEELQNIPPLFEVCRNADELEKYVRYWLKLDLPWHRVDPESTSSPMRFLWQVYKTMLTGEGAHTHILAASRNSMKSLMSAAIQFLSIMHFRRNGTHVAATLDQSAAVIGYLDSFMNIPELDQYQVKDSVKIKIFKNLPPNSFTVQSEAKIQVVTATKKGANAQRASTLTFDETDLVPQEILDELAGIGDPTRDGRKFNPIFIYLSSRKTNSGPLQNLIDSATKDNNKEEMLHKWSIADFMEPCPTEVHKPELGAVQAYVNTETLEVVWGEETFKESVDDASQGLYKQYSAYEGCRTCPAFIPCLGLSAKQKGNSIALRHRSFTAGIVRRIKDVTVVIAQYLNWRPESTSNVFRMFNRFKNYKAPEDFYEWVTNGVRFNPFGLAEEDLDRLLAEGSAKEIKANTPTKMDIYKALVEYGWTLVGGVDFGHSPDPAVGTVVGYHRRWKRACLFHTTHANGYANHLWGEHLSTTVYSVYPVDFVAPDLADKSAPTYFTKFGINSLDTKPSRIAPGVSFIRGLLWNPIDQRTDFAVLDDSGIEPMEGNRNEFAVNEFEIWRHKKTPMGFDLSNFEDANNHAMDAIRYALDFFIEEEGDVSIHAHQSPRTVDLPTAAALGDKEAQEIIKEKSKFQNQYADFLHREHGLQNPFKKPEEPADNSKGKKKGPVKFKFGPS